jgi:hypothetical protein
VAGEHARRPEIESYLTYSYLQSERELVRSTHQTMVVTACDIKLKGEAELSVRRPSLLLPVRPLSQGAQSGGYAAAVCSISAEPGEASGCALEILQLRG